MNEPMRALIDALDADGRLAASRARRESLARDLPIATSEARRAAWVLEDERADITAVQSGLLGIYLRITRQLPERVARETAEFHAADDAFSALTARIGSMRAELERLEAEAPALEARAERLPEALEAARHALAGRDDAEALLSRLRTRERLARTVRELGEASRAADVAASALEVATKAVGSAGQFGFHPAHGRIKPVHPSPAELDRIEGPVVAAHVALRALDRELKDVPEITSEHYGLVPDRVQLDRAVLETTFVGDGTVLRTFSGLRQALAEQHGAVLDQRAALQDERIRLLAELDAIDAELASHLGPTAPAR